MRRALILAIALIGPAISQPINGRITFSSPDANLGFLTLEYINPARSSAVLGGYINPAAYGRVSHFEVNLGFGLKSSATIQSKITLLDSSEYNSSLELPVDISVEDAGGIYGFGLGTKFALLGLGFGILKPYHFAVSMGGSATLPLYLSRDIQDTVVLENRSTGNPYDTVAVTWHVVDTTITDIKGEGKISLDARPIFFGAGIGLGPLSVGAGFKITRFSGGGEPYITAYSTSTINISGTSHEYGGSINGVLSFQDTVTKVVILSDISGTRKAVSVGANLSLGFFKLGTYFEHGFKAKITGSYSYMAIHGDFQSTGLRNLNLSNVYIQNGELRQDSTITGEVVITERDTIEDQYSEVLELPSYNAMGFGISVGFLDLFGGGTLPEKGNTATVYGGAFVRPPLPVVKVRAGIDVNVTFFYTKDGVLVPLSVLPYVGAGVSIPLSLAKVPFGPVLGVPAWIDISAKSNVLSLTSKIIENMVGTDVFAIESTPNPLKTLSFGLGVRIKM